MLDDNEQQQEEMQMLSSDHFSVDELEARLELTTMMLVDTGCIGNLCHLDTCGGDFNW